jgi:hypothetical protein
MFVCVNAAQTDEAQRQIGWKSINQVAAKIAADEGAIMSRIDEMLEGDDEDEEPAAPAPDQKKAPPKEPKK